MENANSKRIVYFDYLRMFAILAVVLLHTASQEWSGWDVRTPGWNACNVYDSMARWGVPVFVMISGALFLSRDPDEAKLWKRNIPRLAVAYIVWSAFYAVCKPIIGMAFGRGTAFSLGSVIRKIITGEFHLWFIPMMIGLYICLPILHRISTSRIAVKYFLILALVFAFALPELHNLVTDFCGSAIIQKAADKMQIHLVLGFSSYFILGHVLHTCEITIKQQRVIYLLGIVGFLFTVGVNAAAAFKANEPRATYFDNFSVNVLCMSVAVFTWCKYHMKKPSVLVGRISSLSFGIYLSHVLIRDGLSFFGINNRMFFPVLSVPLLTIIIILLAFSVAYIISKIPVLKKWII